MPLLFDTFEVLQPPDNTWLNRVVADGWIWLTKEREFAQVAIPFSARYVTYGRIALHRTWRNENQWGFSELQVWHTSISGQGFDGSQILQPIEGFCLEPTDAVTDYTNYRMRESNFFGRIFGGDRPVSKRKPAELEQLRRRLLLEE
jgi:hypothetical protein